MADGVSHGGSDEEAMRLQAYLLSVAGFDPSLLLDNTPNCASDPNPTMGIQINNPEYGQQQPAGMSGRALHNRPIPLPSSDLIPNNNVSRTRTLKTTPKKRETDQKYRAKQKQEKLQKDNKLRRLEEENLRLRNENESLKRNDVSLNENFHFEANQISWLKSNYQQLKCAYEKQNALVQVLSEAYKGKGVALDVDDSGDENDDRKKNTKRATLSAPSGLRSGMDPKFAVAGMDEFLETGQVTLAAKKEFYYDNRAERHGSTSNPTAMVNDPYSIAECIRLLQSMEDIPFSVATKAITKFQSSEIERQTFVALKEDWRREWVKRLEDA